MRPAIENTDTDRSALAEIWTALLGEWPRARDLADLLGVHRTLLHHWCSGARTPTWAATRAGLRLTAARHPSSTPRLMRVVAAHVLDVEGDWIPEIDTGDLAGVTDEIGDVTVACGALLAAVRRGASSQEIESMTHTLVREAHEAAAAARR